MASGRWLRPAGLVLLPLLSAPALAQEAYALAGAQYTRSLDETTYSYALEYQQNFFEHFVGTFTWLNEGHVTAHHRDGYSVQLWARWLNTPRTLTLSAGVGPYRYYDTTFGSPGVGGVTNVHNFGLLYSVAAQWYFHHPWVLQLRYNRTDTPGSIDTDTLLIGFGYQFDAATRPGPVLAPTPYPFTSPERNEVTVLAGNSVQNNFHSPHGVAWALEYRRRLTPYIDITGTYLDEGNTHVVKRRGPAVQGWISREFLSHRASVGIGGGFYFARDQDERGERTKGLGLLTMAVAYRFTEHVATRLHWYRTLTSNGRDTDVVLLGLGYAF